MQHRTAGLLLALWLTGLAQARAAMPPHASAEPATAAAASVAPAAAAPGMPAPSAATPRPAPTLTEVSPGLWVGGEVAVETMPGWPGESASTAPRLFAIVDLRPPSESPRVAAERAAAAAAGVGYVSIPVSRRGPPPATAVAQLAAVIRNAEGAPVVLHCVSGNRAGDLLARYLISQGTDVDSAAAIARRLGTTDERIEALRGASLGHP